MHGVVFTKLKQFVEETFDSDTWSAILKEAGHEDEMFVPIKIYPDETLGQVAAAAVKLPVLPAMICCVHSARF